MVCRFLVYRVNRVLQASTSVQRWFSSQTDWDILSWERIMERLSLLERPDPTLLELSFRKLSSCEYKPDYQAMHRDLNFLSKLCKSRNAPSVWSPHETVQVFNSCAVLGYLSPELMGEMGREILARELCLDMDHVELSTMIKALGRLGAVAANTSNLHPCGVFFGISEVVVSLMKEIIHLDRKPSFTERQLTEIWNGLARLRFYNPQFLKDLSVESIKPQRIKYFDEESIVSLLYSSSVLKLNDRFYRRALLDECIQSHRIRAYSTKDLTKIYHSLGLVELTCEKTLRALDQEVIKAHRLQDLSEMQLVIILITCGILRWFDFDLLLRLAEEITKPKRQKILSNQGFYAFGNIFRKLDRDWTESSLKNAVVECIAPNFTPIFYKNLSSIHS